MTSLREKAITIRTLLSRTRNCFFGTRKDYAWSFQRLLPENVRYALGNNGGRLGRRELRALVDNGFIDESIYLVAKALDYDPLSQLRYLNDLVLLLRQFQQDQSSSDQIGQLLHKNIDGFPDKHAVHGTKLAQISRQGFETWRSKFDAMAEDLSINYPEKTPVLIGNASFLGLRSFIQAGAGDTQPLFILKPTWIHDETTTHCGYQINVSSRQPVSIIEKGFSRPDDFILVDDTYRTGSTIDQMWQFMTGSTDPVDRSQLRVIANANNI